ncbi:hypothetical protein ABFG93_07365 [Pseudalkalibacillus hwajinpoensis]|uniref:hypothetical protein n=1 Tax=Guptibacillus hwajinpoensis TaxID=208199 RepID=UPI00325AF3AE
MNHYKLNRKNDPSLKLTNASYNGNVNVDEKINEAFYSDQQKNDSTPTGYLGNDTAAIDVTGNKDEDR